MRCPAPASRAGRAGERGGCAGVGRRRTRSGRRRVPARAGRGRAGRRGRLLALHAGAPVPGRGGLGSGGRGCCACRPSTGCWAARCAGPPGCTATAREWAAPVLHAAGAGWRGPGLSARDRCRRRRPASVDPGRRWGVPGRAVPTPMGDAEHALCDPHRQQFRARQPRCRWSSSPPIRGVRPLAGVGGVRGGGVRPSAPASASGVLRHPPAAAGGDPAVSDRCSTRPGGGPPSRRSTRPGRVSLRGLPALVVVAGTVRPAATRRAGLKTRDGVLRWLCDELRRQQIATISGRPGATRPRQ